MRDRVFVIARAVVVVTLASIVTIIALPSPLRSHAWDPPRAPNLEGPFAPNELLLEGERLANGQIVGPEGIAVDARGWVYSGTTDGKIVRVRQGSPVEVFTETAGRPLGMRFGPVKADGTSDLFVADAMKGLVRVDSQGNIEVLTHEVEGTPLVFADDVMPSADGRTLYLTDASGRWHYGEQVNDTLEADPTGRLIKFDLETRSATVLVRGLAFGNGVVLAPDESYLLVNETARYRITRVWLTGDRRNTTETFVDNLPGFPDNITLSPRGTYWVALFAARDALLDAAHPFPFVKDCLAALPMSVRPQHKPVGLVFEMDAQGRVLRSLHDPAGARFRDVTTALEFRGDLYLGTLTGTAIGRITLAPTP